MTLWSSTAQMLSLVIGNYVTHMSNTSLTSRKLATRLAMHHILAWAIMHVSHLNELVVGGAVSISTVWLRLVVAHHTLTWRAACHHHRLLSYEALWLARRSYLCLALALLLVNSANVKRSVLVMLLIHHFFSSQTFLDFRLKETQKSC